MSDLVTRDYEGFKQSMLQGLKEKIPTYSDFSDYDPGVTIIQLLAYALDGLSYYNERAVNNLSLDTATNRESVVKIANQFDYTPSGSSSAKFKQVFEILSQATPYTIPKGFVLTTDEVNVADRQVYELTADFVIPANCTGLEKNESNEFLYTADIAHGITVSGVVLGTSNESKYQQFRIEDKYVLSSTIEVWVNEGSGAVKWNKVDNFVNCFSDDLVYRVIYDGVYHYIEFGSGSLGKIPTTFQGGIAVNYRRGGGIIGNVGANTITQMVTPLSKVLHTYNPEIAYELGIDMESTEDIKEKAVAKLRTLARAVTLTDYEDLAKEQLSYVLKIKATNTSYAVTLYVLTNDNPTTGLIAPATQTKLEDFYNDKRMLNTTITISNPTFLTCDLSIILWIADNFDASDTQALVNTYLTTQFAFGGYDFGEELIISALTRDIMNIIGVKAVSITVTSNGGQTLPDATEIVKLGTITWDVRGGI